MVLPGDRRRDKTPLAGRDAKPDFHLPFFACASCQTAGFFAFDVNARCNGCSWLSIHDFQAIHVQKQLLSEDSVITFAFGVNNANLKENAQHEQFSVMTITVASLLFHCIDFESQIAAYCPQKDTT